MSSSYVYSLFLNGDPSAGESVCFFNGDRYILDHPLFAKTPFTNKSQLQFDIQR
ncbi:hypothetical protein [Sphingobacterium paucimobilis]|uniref:hypothetical protein n=1 Tax=Sphingobacterium paucimobilis TaxID=1385985 RepID=UPI00130E550D|nr:hypothetical protein [Sphingobacterium paucimobilis]